MMRKLVDEEVVGEIIVDRGGRIDVVQAAAAVCGGVGQHRDELVRRPRRDVAPGAILERQDVTLGTERVIRGTGRRASIYPGGGPRDAGLGGGRTDPPDVEVVAARLEGFLREERRGHATRIRAEFSAALGRRVAIAEQQHIDLRLRLPVPLHLDRLLPRGPRSIDEGVGRVNRHSPRFVVSPSPVPLGDDDVSLAGQRRKAQRVVKRAPQPPHFGRGHPFGEGGIVAAREHHAPRGVDDFEAIVAGWRGLEVRGRGVGPRQRLDHDAVEAVRLDARSARLVEVEAPRARWFLRADDRERTQHKRERTIECASLPAPIPLPAQHVAAESTETQRKMADWLCASVSLSARDPNR